MYGRSRLHVKAESRSTYTFTRGLSKHCLYIIYARKHYATVEVNPRDLPFRVERDDTTNIRDFN